LVAGVLGFVFGHGAGQYSSGPAHTIFPRCVVDQKGHAQGAKRRRAGGPARLRNAAHGLFGHKPKGTG
ncbi:hypothetical protein, partial [Hydrogenophaga sp.]|uniref:hypothetical protein n=1 Tax=Hydrogenophaga sp. TaxID=1904254 RepID=UPI00260A2B82